MTVTDRTDATEQEFRSRIAAFETAPTPPEVRESAMLEKVARAIWDSGHGALPPWDKLSEASRGFYRIRAAAAVAAYRATQDGGAEEAVRRAADWLCKEYGELLDGDAEGPAGYWEFQARELLEALAPQADR